MKRSQGAGPFRPAFPMNPPPSLLAVSALALLVLTACAHQPIGDGRPAPTRVLAWGDQGDGTYRNPVLKSDYSDPDLLRVEDEFYLIASDFHFSTMQVLHSRDLVNWQLCGKVFDRLTMGPKYDQMKAYGEGTWAPSLREHNGEFYIYVCTPYDGLFMWHAKNPAGPWSDTVTVKAVARWEDPCPFWDDDGQAYLVHGLKGAGPIIINRMSPDGTRLLDEGREVYRGQNAEGPKLQKRNGYYYISLPEGGFATGWQTMLRSRNIYGPYERQVVFASDGQHQGGFVELANGESWFICFKRMYDAQQPMGRICYLEPVQWGEDDWPVFGDNGHPVTVWRKPSVGRVYPIERPVTDDEFTSPVLGLQWQWNHNPLDDRWSLQERPGYLRLKASPAASFATARNTLTQKLWDDAGVVDTKFDLGGMAEGQRAGLAFMYGMKFGWIGVAQDGTGRKLEWDGGKGPALAGNTLWLRETYQADQAHFAYSLDGRAFTDAGVTFNLGYANWKGSRPALYSFGPHGGYVDVDYFHYSYGATVAEAMAPPARP
jgi:beta-xylosidase